MSMDMTPYDPDEVARVRARPDCHSARMRFALHVSKVCPTHVWAHMFFAHWAADREERLYHLGNAVPAGEQQPEAESNGTATRERDAGEDKLFKTAIYRYAYLLATFGEMSDAGRTIAKLSRYFPEETERGLDMARRKGVFPEEAVEIASIMTM